MGLAVALPGCSSGTDTGNTPATGPGATSVTTGTVAPADARKVADLLIVNTAPHDYAEPSRSKATLPPVTLPLTSFSAFTLINPQVSDQSRDLTVAVAAFDSIDAATKRRDTVLGRQGGKAPSTTGEGPGVGVIMCGTLLVFVQGNWQASHQTLGDYAEGYFDALWSNGYDECRLEIAAG